MRLHLALCLFFVCALLAPGLTRADAPVSRKKPLPDPAWGGIEGKLVSQEQSLPVAGVSVTVRGGDIEKIDLTGADGTFRIAGLPPGEYKVTLDRDGSLYEHGQPVRVVNRQMTAVTLFAPPPPAPAPPPPPPGPRPPRPIRHTPDPQSKYAQWMTCRVLSSFQSGAELVLYLNRGSDDNLRVGSAGVVLDAADPGYVPIGGSEFMIVRLLPGNRAEARIKGLRTLGKNNECIINAVSP